VIQQNYTYDWLYGQMLQQLDPLNDGYDMFQFFDVDLYETRLLNSSKWYNGGGYLVYQANTTSN
jgi:hypothetical protein